MQGNKPVIVRAKIQTSVSELLFQIAPSTKQKVKANALNKGIGFLTPGLPVIRTIQ
jgi:hypothetical protein